jgi:hypothetical protein
MRKTALNWLLFLMVGLSTPNARAASDATEQFQELWTHAAPHSAVIYWRMKDIADDAVSYVQYGPTSKYGLKTPITTASRWAHLHRMGGLKPGVQVHYRPVLVCKGKKILGPSGKLTTPNAIGWTPLPGKLAGPPYILDKGGKYFLTEDIATPGNAITISAPDVVLDLDGRTVRFGTKGGKQAAGIQIRAKGSATVRNGVMVQGDGSADYSAAIESRWRAFPRDIYAMTVTVHRPNGYPIKFLGGSSGVKVHHNLLTSRVTKIESRHYPGNDLIRVDLDKSDNGACRIYDNILTGGCHRGITVTGESSGSQIFGNDIRHQAMYVNGYAINLHAPGIEAYNNRITSIGRGMHLTRPQLIVRDNHLDLRGLATLDDMPAKSPFRKIMVELHGIKLEGVRVSGAKVYRNFVRIRQLAPADGVRYVPATPLNVACYNPTAMNEIYDNDIVALTYYRSERIGGYGDSGQWASSIHLVGMTRRKAPAGKYSAYIHNNRFVTNHLFVSATSPVTQTVRIEKNSFALVKIPATVPAKARLRKLGPLKRLVETGGNTFRR